MVCYQRLICADLDYLNDVRSMIPISGQRRSDLYHVNAVVEPANVSWLRNNLSSMSNGRFTHTISTLYTVGQGLFEQQDITVICTIHFHPWLHDNHTSAWRHRPKPTHRNMFIRNQRGTSMSWSSVWLKSGQQPAELHWSSDWSVARLF